MYAAVSTYKEFPGRVHSVLGQPGWKVVAAYASDWIEQKAG
jgi:hypothetical protein